MKAAQKAAATPMRTSARYVDACSFACESICERYSGMFITQSFRKTCLRRFVPHQASLRRQTRREQWRRRGAAAAAQAEKLAQLKAEEAEMQKKEAEGEHGSREGAGGGGRKLRGGG
eukprot:scaffold133346_cov72-Phaeocystis_antarctica.AAC.1